MKDREQGRHQERMSKIISDISSNRRFKSLKESVAARFSAQADTIHEVRDQAIDLNQKVENYLSRKKIKKARKKGEI